MYDLILEAKLATAAAAVLLAVLASTLAGSPRLWLRGSLYSLTAGFATAFYAVALFAPVRPHAADLLAGFFFELTILVFFFRLLRDLMRDVESTTGRAARQMLAWSLVFQVVFFFPNVLSGGFGIFSDGSRIEYLNAGSLPKYFTYAGLLITMVQAALLASLVSAKGQLGKLGWFVIFINFVLSVTSGSKGGVFLWLLAFAAVIDFRRARISTYKVVGVALVAVSAVLVSSLVVAQFLGLDLDVFLELALNRFFLNNDARALALDLRSPTTGDMSLFSESFRSLGNLFGLSPRNDPLGVLLYAEGLSITNGNGANASFMALASYYFPMGYALVPAVLGVVGAVAVVGLARMSVSVMATPARRLAVGSVWLTTFLNYSQDFLAFQVVLPLAVLSVLALGLLRQPPHDSKRVSVA